jgi:hypothetical protein
MSIRSLLLAGLLASLIGAAAGPALAGTYHAAVDPNSSNIGDVVTSTGPTSASVALGPFDTGTGTTGVLAGQGSGAARANLGSVGARSSQWHYFSWGYTGGNGVESYSSFRLDDIIVSGAGTSTTASVNMLLDGLLRGEVGRINTENGGQSTSRVEIAVILNGTTFTGKAEILAEYAFGRYPRTGSFLTATDSGLLNGVLPTPITPLSGSGRAVSYDVSILEFLTTPDVVVPVGTAFDLEFRIKTWASSGGSGSAGNALTDFYTSLAFPSGPVLNLANGYTAWSAEAGDLSSSVAVVPLPGSLPMLAVGLAFAGLLRWRRRRTSV